MKRVAVLVVNPVNGAGLFQYLEAFFENGVAFRTFAVAETTGVTTNSGVALTTDDVVANLRGHESEYDALVFACGDAMPRFGENAAARYNQDMLAVIRRFDDEGRTLIGHCAAALLYDMLGVGHGRRVALHPFLKDVVKGVVPTDEEAVVDGNLFTARTENTIPALLPAVLKELE